MGTLSYRGIDAWLHGKDGKHLPLGPVVVEGNQITTVVELKSPKAYHLMWCKSRDAPSINARCDMFRPAGKTGFIETARIANYYMNADDAQTQSRSSKGRLEHPLPRDSWLWTPKRRPGFVSLEIRRLQGPAKEIQRRDETGPGTKLYEMSLDYLDEIDAPPYIIFRFEFKQTVEETAGSSSGTDKGRGRTHRRVRARSAEVVVLVDSGSEDPDEGSGSTSRKQKHRAAIILPFV
ncbi:hypothetical protein B0H11DRAFT_2004733 [Mycena galericulata]|nr:hypothetical protein B0H11DRAFT_2004733 [Mycena galericulata]